MIPICLWEVIIALILMVNFLYLMITETLQNKSHTIVDPMYAIKNYKRKRLIIVVEVLLHILFQVYYLFYWLNYLLKKKKEK